MTTLEIEARDTKKSLDALRGEGKIPAVLYGPKEPTASVAVDAKIFGKVFKEAGESTVVTLEGLGEAKDAMIHEVAYHPVTGKALHVDFYVIEKGKKVQTHVPLQFTGEAPAVKNLGGTLMKIMHEIEIEAMPKDLPHEIVVDISVLETFDSHITLADLRLPPGVTALGQPEDTIASIAEPKEEEEEPVEAIDMESIEVEKKGKQEEEGAEATEPAEKEEEKK
ncbi:MAG TPA: 50S ribosomal protein L25 [Candidatus Paceibacterota bacterium]|nr:50S ribosomal protein L25 [Candidatus Paceibacterota bacterium]